MVFTWRVLEGSLVLGTESGKFSPKFGLDPATLEMARVQKVHGAAAEVVGRRDALMQLKFADDIVIKGVSV